MASPSMGVDAGLEAPFGSIEGSHEYIALLEQVVKEAEEEIRGHAAQAAHAGAGRREEALRLVAHKLTRLELHLATSRRILNDLRTLRRLLFGERQLRASALDPVGAIRITHPLSAAAPPTRVRPES